MGRLRHPLRVQRRRSPLGRGLSGGRADHLRLQRRRAARNARRPARQRHRRRPGQVHLVLRLRPRRPPGIRHRPARPPAHHRL
nr:hypothetical protein [Streptomyces parvulus]